MNNAEEIKRTANNALYFDDNSDYATALWQICSLLGMDEDDIGEKFIEDK